MISNLCLTTQEVIKKNHLLAKRAYPWSFMYQRIVSGIMLAMFPLFMNYYVFEREVSNEFQIFVGTNDYVSYIIIGLSIYILAFSTLMNVGRAIITEIREGTIDAFVLSSGSRMGYFLGVYIEQFGRSCVEFICIYIVGILLGAKINISQIHTIIFFVLLISISCFSMSIFISSIMVYTRDTYLTQNTIIIAIGFFSGIMFPIEYLPEACEKVAAFIPITTLLQAFRNVVLRGQSMSLNFSLIIWGLIISAFYMMSGYFWYLKLEKKIIEDVFA